MAQQITEITKVPTNAQVIKILNEVIKRYNSLANVYTFKGSVETYNDLLAIQNPAVGDVYNVKQEDTEHGVAAGSNFVWDGNVWDNLGMSLDGLVRKINGFTPDDLGSVIFKYIKSIEDEDGTLNIIVREGESETQLTIQTGKVKTVNGFVPDDLGAVIFQYIKNITDNDGTLTITVRNGEEESTLTIDTGKVKTVNGEEPDETGNISIEVPQPTIATKEEAEAGTDNTKFMTPLRTKEAIDAQTPSIMLDMVYPVGSIYLSTNATNPTVLFGGTWEAYAQGRVLIGAGTGTDSRSERKTFAAGSTGGEYNHQLTVGELASHNHSGSAAWTSLTGTLNIPNGQGKIQPTYYNATGIVSVNGFANYIGNSTGGGGGGRVTINASHSHNLTINNIGNSAAHNNTQPYITCYIWHRIA